MKKLLQMLALLTIATPLLAGLREPDGVIWGAVIVDRVAVTSADTDVAIEARRTPSGPPIASYQMGSLVAAGNFYSLRLIVESGMPLSDPSVVLAGDTVYIVVRKGLVDHGSQTVILAGRGAIQRLDFGSLDSDNDGIPDDWELRYFGSTTVNPGADPDGDGASNLREFLEGTNPTVKDARHPADRSPNDGRISVNEVTAYGLAWHNNTAWPVDPNPIPMAYVTRAGALWKNGEIYTLDTKISTTAPLWWTNPPIASLTQADPKKEIKAADEITATSIRSLSVTNNGLLVRIDVRPAPGNAAYAVEEFPAVGWNVEEISHDGHIASDTRIIRWGPFMDGQSRRLTFRLVAAGALGPITFNGAASFDGSNIPTGGALTLNDVQGALSLSIAAQSNLLIIHGIPGQLVDVEVSTELQAWTTLQQIKIGDSGVAQLSISPDSNAFFRAHLAQ